MRKLTYSLLFLFSCFQLMAQDGPEMKNPSDKDLKLNTEKMNSESRDRLIIEFNHTGLSNVNELLETKWYSRGLNIYYTYDFPIGNSKHFSVAPGLGFSSHNVYSNSFVTSGTVGEVANFSFFQPRDESLNWTTNKLNTNLVEAPIELRFHSKYDNNGRSFKVALGIRLARLLSSKTKYRGEAVTAEGVTGEVKIKDLRLPNMFKYRYGPSIRIGYGELSAVFYYSLSSLFDENFGPDIRPWSVGISFNSF